MPKFPHTIRIRLRPLVAGVIRTTGETHDRRAFEVEARRRLGERAVPIRWQWSGRSQLAIWWATGPSNVADLAGCAEMAGEARLEAAGDTLVVTTDVPHIWVGKRGWRVNALQAIWGVHISVQTTESDPAVKPQPASASPAAARTFLQRLWDIPFRRVPSAPAA